jgi:AraC family transcriptional regulator
VSAAEPCQFDRILFDTASVRVGAFRCHPSHPFFHDSGPTRNLCFVFPRTAVEIQHEHEPAFVANPNVVTFYNRGQAYLRNAISDEGDRCDWFAAQNDIVLDVVRSFNPEVDSHPEAPFSFTRGWSDSATYLLQRQLFERIVNGSALEPLAVEETVVQLLENVVRSAHQAAPQSRRQTPQNPRKRDIIHHIELILSDRLEERLTLAEVATEVGISAYYLCRLFHGATGTTLHDYRQNLRLRWSLENVASSDKPLVDIALEAGFSSHSHFTRTFRRQFAQTPSSLRECDLTRVER